MKSKGNAITRAAVLAAFWSVGVVTLLPRVEAQNYSIAWFKIGAAHAASTNGQFSLVGAIGQHDAHPPLRGGSYSLTGGFWSFLTVVQTPGAPELSISFNGPQKALISWPATETEFSLQQSATLNPGSWVEVTNSAVLVNGIHQIEVTATQGRTFYRLQRR